MISISFSSTATYQVACIKLDMSATGGSDAEGKGVVEIALRAVVAVSSCITLLASFPVLRKSFGEGVWPGNEAITIDNISMLSLSLSNDGHFVTCLFPILPTQVIAVGAIIAAAVCVGTLNDAFGSGNTSLDLFNETRGATGWIIFVAIAAIVIMALFIILRIVARGSAIILAVVSLIGRLPFVYHHPYTRNTYLD